MRGVLLLFLIIFQSNVRAEFITSRNEALPVEFTYYPGNSFEPMDASEELDQVEDICVRQMRSSLRLYFQYGPYQRLREQIRENYGKNAGILVSYQINEMEEAEVVFSGTRNLVEDHAPQSVINIRKSGRCPMLRPSFLREYLRTLNEWSKQFSPGCRE